MILWNDTVSLGDVICSFPATRELIRRGGFKTLYWTNAAASELFPHAAYGVTALSTPPAPPAPVHRISMHDMVHFGRRQPSRHEHPTAQFLAHCGFPELSTQPVRPEIVFSPRTDLPRYDIIISPYILAEIERLWPLHNWQWVIDNIKVHHPECSIAVIANTTMFSQADLAKINPYGQAHFYENARLMQPLFTGVSYELDRPLPEVACLMRDSRLNITVDSGPARLAYAVGNTHLLLCNNRVSYQWGTYPEATTLFTDMTQLQPAQVTAQALRLLA